MAQDNNQPSTTEQGTTRLQGWPLENYSFTADSLENTFKLGPVFNDDLYKAMKEGKTEFDFAADIKMKDTGEWIRVNPRFEEIETQKGKMIVVQGIRASLLDDKDKPTVSHDFQVFGKNGFDANQMRNALEGRSVRHFRKSQNDNVYPAYLQLDLTGPKDEHGNFKQVITPEFRLKDYDPAALLSQVGLPKNYDKKALENLNKRLENGDLVPIPKRGSNNQLEVFHLFAMPEKSALATIDEKGELKLYKVQQIEGVRRINQQSNQESSQGQTGGSKEDMDKASKLQQQMAETKGKEQAAGKRPKAA